MSLLVGISCPQGAVLVTDSALALSDDGGKSWEGTLKSKTVPIPSFSGAAIACGVMPAELPAADTLDDFSRKLQSTVLRLYDLIDTDSVFGKLDTVPDFIIAGTEGGRVRLGYARRDEPLLWAPEAGGIFMGGFAAPWHQPYEFAPPIDLAACAALAQLLASTVIAGIYRNDGCRTLNEYLDKGIFPPVALPLEVTTLRPGSINIESQLRGVQL